MLEGAGYDVDTAETGDEALQRLCAVSYRLAILDMHIPGLDGIDILHQYHLLRPRSHLPIIMLTANASLEAQQKSAEAGADAYLTKPVTAADLLNEVERLIMDSQVEVLPHRLRQDHGIDEAAKTSGPNILDTGVLAELDRLYHNPRELTSLVAEYEREGRVLVDRIARACATRNHSAFCDGVHALKSNAANIGAMKLMQACRQAEAAGIVEFMRRRQQELALMQDAFAETVVALRGLLTAAPQAGDADRSRGEP
jgi:two-component system sensor histidine kinase RpfC